MPKAKDYQKVATKLTAEVAKLKSENMKLKKAFEMKLSKNAKQIEEWLDEEFKAGYETAYNDMNVMQDAFDQYMDKAAAQFEKELLKKGKPETAKKITKKKVAKKKK